MASLRKFPNSKNYYACFTLPGGRRRQVSTGTDDKALAMEYALKMERAAKGAKRAGSFGERQARKMLREIAIAVGDSVLESTSYKEFMKVHLSQYRAEGVRTAKRRAQVLQLFGESLGKDADEPIEYLTSADVRKWMNQNLERGISPNSANMMLSYVAQLIKEAVSENLILRDITQGCRIKGAKKQATRRKAFSRGQFERLKAVTDGEWKTLIMIAALTGQRLGDCRKLKWKQVDFQKGVIAFRREKNKDEFYVPIMPQLAHRLQEIFRAAPEEYVMRDLATRPATGRISISDVFRNEILPKIGISQKYGGKKGDGRTVAAYSFHSLRHSCSTWLADAGIPEEARMLFIGHEDSSVNRSYTHATGEQAKRTLAAFSAVFEEGAAQ